MEQKKFKFINRIFSVMVLLTAAVTYLLTIEPTVSFWDCGEFIASSYKLEVGHAPGNPVFQLIARVFTMFASPEHAAMAVNVMSALCSAFTIFFLYLTIVHLGRRIIEKNGRAGELSMGEALSLIGAGIVGSLAYCWSDTFWFSAVEAEVYAMSSLFTAAVFWMILKWEEQADTEYADRWIVAIAFLMGLSIGVHLLNLLVIPAIAFVYYYKKASKVTTWGCVGVLALSAVILAVVLWGIIPYLPKIAAVFDLLFVNVFHLPFNSGAAFFLIVLLVLCFLAVYLTYRKGSLVWNIISLCFTMIVIGYSAFAMVVIRSANNTPTNEGQPDNPFALVKYLGREQYGSAPLVYGQTFASVYDDFKIKDYYTKMDSVYYKAPGPAEVSYPAESKMFFPRMHSKDPSHVRFYESYTQGRGKVIPGTDRRMPTFADNMRFFFDYQLNYMYMRYFLWNFAGRQNDLHGQVPGDPVKGNWECGIGFIDRARLGDQSEGPDYIVNNKGKNHYYMLPLLLGIIGLLYQLGKDKRNWWITFLLFFLTGIAIILYLNQTPYQVRERDYAYAGSFYMFSIWIGLAVLAVYDWLRKPAAKVHIPEKVTAVVVSVLLLGVPVLMAFENWDDHDRSNRYTARDMAYNYFMSTDPQAILITHGDNDTFPLWYIQEVEGTRLDARVMNTSLLGIDWYIDQMQWKQYDAEPIRFTTPRINYLYGTNDYVQVIDRFNRPILLRDAIQLFNDPRVKVNYYGREESYVPASRLLIPVNKENVIKNRIVPEEDYDKILDTLCLEIPLDRDNLLEKPELMILDMLANYDWERPVYFMTQGGSLDIGIEDYLQFDGFTYKFVPIKSRTTLTSVEQVDTDAMYDRIMNVYRLDSFSKDFFVDYQNLSTFNGVASMRFMFVQTAIALYDKGETDRVIQVLDRMQETYPDRNFPLNSSAAVMYVNEQMVLYAIDLYIKCGEKEKGLAMAGRFMEETMQAIRFFAQPYRGSVLSQTDLQHNFQLYQYGIEVVHSADAEKAQEYSKALEDFLNGAV